MGQYMQSSLGLGSRWRDEGAVTYVRLTGRDAHVWAAHSA